MQPITDITIDGLITDFDQKISSSKEFDVKKVYNSFCINVILQMMFGVDVDPNMNEKIIKGAKKFACLNTLLRLLLIAIWPQAAKLFKVGLFSEELSQYFRLLLMKTVEERKCEQLNGEKSERQDLLQLFIDAEKNGKRQFHQITVNTCYY